MTFELFKDCGDYVKVYSTDPFVVKSDMPMFNDAVIQYDESDENAGREKIYRVRITLSCEGDFEYYEIMESGFTSGMRDYVLSDFLESFYHDILKPISANIEEGIFSGFIQIGKFGCIRVFVNSSCALIDPSFPYACFMIGCGDDLIDTMSDEMDENIANRIKKSKGFQSLIEVVNNSYEYAFNAARERIRNLKSETKGNNTP